MASRKQTTIEDDVDDLDDVLDQFNAPSTSAAKPPTQPKAPTTVPNEPEIDDEDFEKHFAAEMEAFMKSISDPASTAAGPIDPKVAQEAEALRKVWEQMLVDDLEGNEATSTEHLAGMASTSKAADASDASSSEDPFQKAVKQAMEKLKESNDSNKAEEADGDLAALLSAFSGLGVEGDGGGNIQGALETLMGQLMSKEILYEPLKELHEKFPGYLEANNTELSNSDLSRYEKQNQVVAKVIAIFDTPGYSDTNPTTTAQIVGLMSEMQEYGSPPAEIMGALPPGIDMGPDGLPALDDKCIIA